MQTEVNTHREVCDGYLYKWLVAAGHAWLERNMEHVNQLNVFPVPDGDTGTNMHHTMRSAYDSALKLPDDAHVGHMAEAVAKGALMGARGNSGVILSQILKGFADGVKELETFNSSQMAEATKLSVKYAYNSVQDPVEGTILTVVRESVDAVVSLIEKTPDIPLRTVLEKLVESSKVSLENTPNLLARLKEAGVVDSGGAGLVYILEGMLRFLEGKPVKEFEATESQTTAVANWQEALEPDDEEGYGYDVQFLIYGQDLDVSKVRADIEAMGWSTLVVGDPSMIKVHVHVFNPAEPLNYAITTLGAEIDDVVVENMQLQYKSYVDQRVARESGVINEVEGAAVIAVATGEGIQNIFKNEFRVAYLIHGGQTMNPSTEDFVAAINAVPNYDVVLLPNNKNILMAAQQAAKITAVNKNVQVVPSRTIPQGIGALMGYLNASPDFELDELVEAMRESMNGITTAEVTRATRSVTLDGVSVSEGQYIGIVEGKLSASGEDLSAVIKETVRHAVHVDSELVTLYYGDNETEASAAAMVELLQEEYPDLEIEAILGGQLLYPYLISVE